MSFLERLPLDCLRGDGSGVACATAVDDVLDELFRATYHGGINGRGQGGACARLFAWDALCALMGLPVHVPFLEAVRRTAGHRWVRFVASTRRRAGGHRHRCHGAGRVSTAVNL
ncbi:DUF6183 family protein [Streptomyces albogriseolus]